MNLLKCMHKYAFSVLLAMLFLGASMTVIDRGTVLRAEDSIIEKELGGALDRFVSSFDGMDTQAKNAEQKVLHRLEVSSDATRLRYTVSANSGDRTQMTGWYVSTSLGQAFATRRVDPVPDNWFKQPHSVRFVSVEDPRAAIAELGEKFGMCASISVADYYKQSERTLSTSDSGGMIAACHHPSLASRVFEFDQSSRLVSIAQRLRAGDKLDTGAICPSGHKTEVTHSFRYKSGEEVPHEVQTVVVASRPKARPIRSKAIFSYSRSEVEHALPSLIDMPDFDVEDGDLVTCAAQPANRYEVHKGRVIAVVDADASEAAKRSRWIRSSQRSWGYYLGLALLGGGVTILLVWFRNR